MNRVVHFEIHAKDMGKAKKFYEDVFGWKMDQMGAEYGSYVVVHTGPGPEEMTKGTVKINDVGINGGITPRKGEPAASGAPVNAFVCIIGVDNIDVYIKKILAAGGTEALAKMDVPGVGLLAYYKDPENNLFGVLQPMPNMPAGK